MKMPPVVRGILVIRQHDQLGDIMCAIPLLRALKHHFPGAPITLVASPVNHDIMLHHPYVQEVLKYDKIALLHSPKKAQEFLSVLRKKHFDLAIVPSTVSISLTSNLLAWLSGAHVRVGPQSVAGVPNKSSFLFNSVTKLDWSSTPRRHQALRNLDVVRHLEIFTDDLSLVVGITDEESNLAVRYLSPLRSRCKMVIGLHPGAGKIMNRWGTDRFAFLAKILNEKYQAGIVITIGPLDGQILKEMRSELPAKNILIVQEPLRNVAAIIDQLDLFITNDTGIMHVAGATKTPVLSLFGPTDPLQWAPIGLGKRFILSKDGTMDGISVEEVIQMVELFFRNRSTN